MRRIGIIAALPGELKPLVKSWNQTLDADRILRWEYEAADAKWIAVCAGIGRAAATRAFAEAEKEAPLTAVLSIGWAGALHPGIPAGQVNNMAEVIDTQTGERFRFAAGNSESRLLTTARVADYAEKRRLAQAYAGSVIVDMEAATIARLASARDIPCYCFKAVSDALDERLPDLNPFIDSGGQFNTMRFAIWSAFRPRYWRALVRFGDNSRKAAHNLASAVEKFLRDEGYTNENR